MAYPTQYRYTKEHQWIEVKGGTNTIGITDYAQNELSDIVFRGPAGSGNEINGRKDVRLGGIAEDRK